MWFLNNKKLPYIAFFIFMLFFNFLIFITPFISMNYYKFENFQNKTNNESKTNDNLINPKILYDLFAFTCHQLNSRSLCLFESGQQTYIGNCAQDGIFSLKKSEIVFYQGEIGYKFPVCARDIAIYFAMLLGILILPFFQKIESEKMPSIWILIFASFPLALDGTLQIFGLYESTNLVRILTGFLAGIVLPFYLLPVINMLYNSFSKYLISILEKKLN